MDALVMMKTMEYKNLSTKCGLTCTGKMLVTSYVFGTRTQSRPPWM